MPVDDPIVRVVLDICECGPCWREANDCEFGHRARPARDSVYEIPQSQRDRWRVAEEAYFQVECEIRKMISEREGLR